MIRPLEKQFHANKVKRLADLIARLDKCVYPDGASRYYAVDLIRVIESGALLAAISIGATLLEVVVRGLVVQYSKTAANNTINLEELLEAKRNLGFKCLIDALCDSEYISNDDAEFAKDFYLQVRIPIQHGLSQRFVRTHKEEWWTSFRQSIARGESITVRELEEVVEDHSIDYLESVISLLERVSSKTS